jgi:hypothetical protein
VELDGFFTSHQRDVLSDLVISKFFNNACSHAGSHVMQLAESAALPIRLVPVVVWLYLTLVHVTSALSLPLTHQRSSSKLQHSGYSPSTSAFSLLISTTIPDFTILEFIFWQ